MDNIKNTIFTVMGALCLGALVVGFANTPKNTPEIPEPTEQVALTGKITRIALVDLMLLTDIPFYSNEDVTCLARNIYFEARNESILGQHMVAWTTMNRVKHRKWRDNVCGVVYQRKQFSWTIKYSKNKTYNRKAYRRAVLIARDTLREFYSGGEDLSNGALFYHADYVVPDWDFSKLTMLAQVDTHIFYKHKKRK